MGCEDLTSFTDRAKCNNIAPEGQVFLDMLEDAETSEEKLGVIAAGVITLGTLKLLGSVTSGVGRILTEPQYHTGFAREEDGQ